MKKKFTQVVTFISAYLFSFSKEEFATKLKQPLFFSPFPFHTQHRKHSCGRKGVCLFEIEIRLGGKKS